MGVVTEHIKDYLKKLRCIVEDANRNKTHTDELSFRTPIDEFLRKVVTSTVRGNQAVVVLEPKNQNLAGRPDWFIYQKNTLAVYGYIEAKGVSPNPIAVEKHAEQFNRYRELGHNLIITDGLDFIFYFCKSAAAPICVSLIDKRTYYSQNWELSANIQDFEICIKEFFSVPQAYCCSEKRLVELIALRTKFLARDIQEIEEICENEARDDKEKAEIRLLTRLKSCITCRRSEYDESLNLGDFLSQVVMFCLLFAHRTLCDPSDKPEAKFGKIRTFATLNDLNDCQLAPFRKIFSIVFDDNNTESAFLRIWIEECIQFLSYVKMDTDAYETPDFHKLYEDFLQKYSPNVKIDYGAFYTPKELAEYLVALCIKICDVEFAGKSFFAPGSVVLDPCCGTGSFLEQILKQSPKVASYDICGIEVLPAPYMLANYRLERVKFDLIRKGVSAKVILANTLSDVVHKKLPSPRNIAEDEYYKVSNQIAKPVQLIICNPPVSDNNRPNVGTGFQEIARLMEDFRPPANKRVGRSNIQKQISNPFMQFVRWSCEVIKNTNCDAILAIVLPSDFLSTPSYKYARKYLLDNFTSAWVILFDADMRVTGNNEFSNLFRTRQGRAAIVLSKDITRKNARISSFRWLDISQQSLIDKRAFLLNHSKDITLPFVQYRVGRSPNSQYTLTPVDDYDRELYSHYWSVNGKKLQETIFASKVSGLKLAPTCLFHCADKAILNRRTRELAGALSDEEIRHDYFDGQKKPPRDVGLTNFRLKVKALGWSNASQRQEINSYIKPYWFRPFVLSYVLENEKLFTSLRQMKNSGMRDRPELRAAYGDPRVMGFALAPSPVHLATELNPFISFCWGLPDNDLCTRGNSYLHTNYYWNKKTNKLCSNVNPILIRALSENLGIVPESCVDSVVFYSYAILSSPEYLNKYKGALYIASDDETRPRIPVIKNKYLFNRIVKLGYLLARLEHPDVKVRNRLQDLDEQQDDFVIPKDFKLSSVSYDSVAQYVVLTDGTCKVRIPCSPDVFYTSISGYSVIEQWVQLHSYIYKRKTFGEEDFALFLDLLNRLYCRQAITQHIDKYVEIVTSVSVNELITPAVQETKDA